MELKIDINLPFEFDLVSLVRNSAGDRYIAVFVHRDRKYATYGLDSEGYCHHGHYLLENAESATADMVRRAMGLELIGVEG